jgi:glycosyltransferase involved in cell wall biosynthesis
LKPAAIAAAWRSRAAVLSNTQGELVGVVPSKWLAREASRGLWKARRIEVIPYGLDLTNFTPIDRGVARTALGIQDDGRPILLVVAQYLEDRRKGMDLFSKALGECPHLTVLAVGIGTLPALPSHVRLIHLGSLDHDRMKALAYNAADVFVHPARADNAPLVIMESIACGTPVVAFPVGGVPELVSRGSTGWLASAVSPSALAASISEATCISGTQDMREHCRQIAVRTYDMARQVDTYESLIQSLSRSRQWCTSPVHNL